MPVIKRYSNRKLYDSESKRYVTLEDLAELIRQGEDVRVLDHVTGEDLTSTTLLQVIFEEQKKIGGLLPKVMLTRLIRAGGETVNSLRVRLSGLDPFQMVDEEIRRRLRALVETGKLNEEESLRIQDVLISKPPHADAIHIPVRSDDAPSEAAGHAEAVSAQEVEDLLRQVSDLEEELNRLKHTPPAA